MKLDLALFVSSKRAALNALTSGGKSYVLLLSLHPGEGKEAATLEVYRTSAQQGGKVVRAPSAHETRMFVSLKERVDFLKTLGIKDDEWEPEEDARA